MYQCFRFTVSGRVQGVFFRVSARDKAQQLGLNGWVRNIRNGQVELLACGKPESIEEFKSWLWQGPKFAKVTEVKSEIVSDAGVDGLQGFEIRRDG